MLPDERLAELLRQADARAHVDSAAIATVYANVEQRRRRAARGRNWVGRLTPAMPAVGIALLVVALVGVAPLLPGLLPTPTPIVSPSPTAPAAPTSGEPGGTTAPTGTPIPQPRLVTKEALVYSWPDAVDASKVAYQVIAVVENQGPGWAQLIQLKSTYNVVNEAGRAVCTFSCQFFYAFPEFVGPGETGYLFNTASEFDVAATDFASVTASWSSSFIAPVEGPVRSFTVNDIAWSGSPTGIGLVASALVRNTGTGTAASFSVAILCVDSGGVVRGATIANFPDQLVAGQSRSVVTVTSTPPLDAADCASSIGLVGEGYLEGPG